MLNYNGNHKVSIVGDIHLNMRSNSLEHSEWERERFLELFTTIADNDSNILILNGDIFDKAKPTFQEIGVFYEALEMLPDMDVYVLDGNHEELSDTSTTFDYLPTAGFSRLKVADLTFNGVTLWCVGHPHIDNISKDLLPISYDTKNILISHYRSDIGYAKEEVDNDLVSRRFDDAVLSDIHYRLTPADNIQYTSSPYGIHFNPDKDYGYCTILIEPSSTYEIDFIKLSLPSKVKVTCTVQELSDTLSTLDKSNKYNVEVSGASTSEALLELEKYSNITKFSFSEVVQEDTVSITDELKEAGDVSVTDIIMVALDDVELSSEDLKLAKAILTEVL